MSAVGTCRNPVLVKCCVVGRVSGRYTMGMKVSNVIHSLYRDHKCKLVNLSFVFCKGVSLNVTFHSVI